MGFPPVPQEIKAISHFLKVADEHDQRNVIVSYWCRMYAVQYAMKLLPGPKAPEVSQLLIALMDWLEKTKSNQKDTEGITNETCAQAVIEEYALKLFNYAESQDRDSKFDKNMVKAFYTAGILFDTLDQFDNLSEDIEEKRKYAKWRAAYIHNCLKKGVIPTPGSTVLLNDNEESGYSDFLPKSELDKIKGRQSDNDNENQELPNSPSPSSSNYPPPNTWNQQPSSQPLLPDIPSQPVLPPAVTPTIPSPSSQYINPVIPSSDTSALTPEQMEKAQKYCKYAGSALNYDDVRTAIDNLQKALHLLQFGKEM